MQNQTFSIMRNFNQIIDFVSMKAKTEKKVIDKEQLDIPEGYVSSEEFAKVFEQKLVTAYENI